MTVVGQRDLIQEDLLHAVERALWRYEPVRSRDLPLSLEFDEGSRLVLRGYAPTLTIKEAILGIAGSVRGIEDVVDELYADPDLEVAVAQALTTDPTTKHLPAGAVQVFSQLGEVVLVGELSEADRQAVMEVAARVEGVRSVVDRMSR